MAQNVENFLNKYPEIYANSPEWALLEYKLQLSLGTTTAIVKKIWAVASNQNMSDFEKRNKGALVLDSHLNTATLDESNKLEKICRKGFDFPSHGLKFGVGYNQINNQQPGITYKMLFSKIAVGKSYCLSGKKYDPEKTRQQPGFDSIYLYNEDQKPDIFRHQYILFNPKDVLPCYVINFEFDSQKQQNTKTPICVACKTNQAKLYCIEDEANLCNECDAQNHKTTLGNKHHRIEIQQKPKGFGNCSTHPEVKLELFCEVCNLPLCINCKISGDHKQGEFANHKIVRIKEAYQSCVDRSREIDPNLQKRKDQLTQLLGNIDIKMKEINKNATAMEEQIYQLLQNALKQLQEHTQRKMSYLIGDQLEIKRQYDQIHWIESFLEYEHQILMPSDFLAAWARHLRLRKEILNLSNIPIITDVKADLKIQGKIRVIIESASKHNTSDININRADRADGGDMGGGIYETPISKMDRNDDGMIGSTPFRKNIFNKHQIDKNALLMKSGLTSNMKNGTMDNESPMKSRSNNLDLAIMKQPGDTSYK